jgi:hypothetical protein
MSSHVILRFRHLCFTKCQDSDVGCYGNDAIIEHFFLERKVGPEIHDTKAISLSTTTSKWYRTLYYLQLRHTFSVAFLFTKVEKYQICFVAFTNQSRSSSPIYSPNPHTPSSTNPSTAVCALICADLSTVTVSA